MKRFDSFREWWIKDGLKNKFDAIFFDIDGTLLSGKSVAIPGALELIRELRRENFPFRLITNDGNHSLQEKSDFLGRAGFDIAPEEIVSCSLALHEAAEEYSLQGENVFVMGDLGKPLSYASLAGMVPVSDPGEINSCRAVIVGEGEYDWFQVINSVLNFFVRYRDRLFLVPNPDSYWPDGKGGLGIGAGGKARFIAGLLKEMGIEQEVIYLGKPYKGVFMRAVHGIMEDFNLSEPPPMERILMVGDFLLSDILGANRLGMTSALLMTGVTKEHHLTSISPEHTPNYVFEAL